MTIVPPEQMARAMQECLQAAFQPEQLHVLDESYKHHGHAGANGSGFGSHFRIRIAAPCFVGKTRVAQHRLVYDALRIFIEQGVHALAIEIIQE